MRFFTDLECYEERGPVGKVGVLGERGQIGGRGRVGGVGKEDKWSHGLKF